MTFVKNNHETVFHMGKTVRKYQYLYNSSLTSWYQMENHRFLITASQCLNFMWSHFYRVNMRILKNRPNMANSSSISAKMSHEWKICQISSAIRFKLAKNIFAAMNLKFYKITFFILVNLGRSFTIVNTALPHLWWMRTATVFFNVFKRYYSSL